MIDPLLSLSDLLSILDLDPYYALPRERDTFAQLKKIRKRANDEDNEYLLRFLSPLEQREIVRIFAAGSISPRNTTESQLNQLGQILLMDTSISVRLALARTLSRMTRSEAIGWLLRALISSHEPHLTSVLAAAIRDAKAPVSWEDKVRELLGLLQEDDRYREHLDLSVLVSSILPDDDELRANRFALPDMLINCAPNRDERMIGILAGLILASCGQDSELAISRVEQTGRAYPENSQYWEALNKEIFSGYTNDSVEAAREMLQERLKTLHNEIAKAWEGAIHQNQRKYKFRMYVSGILAFSGICMLGIAVYLLGWKDVWEAGLTVAISAIIVLVLSVYLSGRVNEDRQGLADIGKANAVYGAYLQRILMVSHVQLQKEFLYQLPPYESLGQTNQYLNEILQQTIEVLQEDKQPSLDDLLDRLS